MDTQKPSPSTPDGLIIAEIVSSEKNYMHELRTCLEVFLRPLKLLIVKDPVLTQEQYAILECNLEAVFSLSKTIVFEAERKKRCVGQLFADEAESMRIAYVRFVSLYLKTYELHTRLMRDRIKPKHASQSYAKFVDEASLRQAQRVRKRTLLDFLILPIQRVPRYRLLLIELWKKLPNGLDRDWTKEAVLRISAVATEMNRALFYETSRRKLIREETAKRLQEEKQDDEASNAMTDLFAEEEDQMLASVESLSQNLYRPRPPTLFSLDYSGLDPNESKDDTTMLVTREEELEHLCLARGWIDVRNGPTTNPFALLNIVSRPDPFADARSTALEINSKRPATSGKHHHADFRLVATQKATSKGIAARKPPSASQLTMRLLKGVYTPMTACRPFHAKTGDVVVVGPIRSGQTPILQILESLRAGGVVPVTALLDRVHWLEGDDWDDRISQGRLVKTHGRLNQAFGGVLVPAPKHGKCDFKVVAVLRHPADLRLSFYRHCRRVYRKCIDQDKVARKGDEGDGKYFEFDDVVPSPADFSGCLVQYEAFVADVLKVILQQESPQLKIIFYEQLLVQPKRVIQQLSEYTGLGQANGDPPRLVDEIALALRSSLDYPLSRSQGGDSSHRVGSTAQGRAELGRLAMAKLDECWTNNVASVFPQFSSYEALYLSMNQTLLPGTNQLPSGATIGASSMNGSRASIVKNYIGYQVIAPLVRMARSGSMLLGGGGNTETILRDRRASQGSNMSFATNTVRAEVMRPSSFVATSKPSSVLTLRRRHTSSTAGPRSTHLGINTPVSQEGNKRSSFSVFKIKRTSDTNSDHSASTDHSRAVATGTFGRTNVHDPDDSDHEEDTKGTKTTQTTTVSGLDSVSEEKPSKLKRAIPNFVGERM